MTVATENAAMAWPDGNPPCPSPTPPGPSNQVSAKLPLVGIYPGRDLRVDVFTTVATISLSATASPASNAVFSAYESFRRKPIAYRDTGIAAIATDVAVLLITELNPWNAVVLAKGF